MEHSVALLERWVTDYQPVVYRAACLILRDPVLAEDVAQETFIRAHRAAGKVPLGAEVRPWLYRIATNLALNHLRSRRREERAFGRAGAAAAVADDVAERGATASAVAGALARLPERLRVTVILRYYLDLSEHDIARTLRIRPGTVKSRLHDARRQLASDESIAAAAG